MEREGESEDAGLEREESDLVGDLDGLERLGLEKLVLRKPDLEEFSLEALEPVRRSQGKVDLEEWTAVALRLQLGPQPRMLSLESPYRWS